MSERAGKYESEEEKIKLTCPCVTVTPSEKKTTENDAIWIELSEESKGVEVCL